MGTLPGYAGIPRRTWREWERRRGVETKHNNNIPKAYYLTPAEVGAIVAYCAGNPLKGYRVQCWEMVDRDVAFVSCSSVYNVIKRHNLGKKWAWLIDFSYIMIAGAFYYFLGILDGFSR